MKLLVKTFLLFLSPVFAPAQETKEIDSLKQSLKTAQNDPMAFTLNYKLADYYRERNKDTALYYLEKNLILAQRNNKKLDEANVLDSKGNNLASLGKLSESYQCLTLAFKIVVNP